MIAPTPWLPATTLATPRAAAPFVEVVAAWSRDWFAAKAWRAETSFQPESGDAWSIVRDEPGFALAARPKASIELALALLGAVPTTPPREADHKLLRRLASRALDDLAGRISAILPRTIEASGTRMWQLGIGHGGARFPFALRINQAVLIAATRRAFSPRRAPATLTLPRAALRDIEVEIAGHLGSARLAVAALGDLDVGDLLVLDTPAGAPARLAVEGRPSDLFFAIGENGDRLSLTMQD